MGALDRLVSNKADNYSKILEWWKDQKLVKARDYNDVLDNFMVLFACHSSKIEGSGISYHTTRDIFEGSEIKGFSGPAIEILEIQNQKYAFNFLLSSLESNTPISKEFILKLHRIMMYGCYSQKRYDKGERPGSFKVNDYCVGLTDEGSVPEEVESDIDDLVSELEVADNKNIVTVAAYFHLKMESIHPFADGNGRVGRTVMNYLLMLNGHPPIVLFNEDRDTYYMALAVFDNSGEISGMVEFLKEQTIKTWSKVLRRKS